MPSKLCSTCQAIPEHFWTAPRTIELERFSLGSLSRLTPAATTKCRLCSFFHAVIHGHDLEQAHGELAQRLTELMVQPLQGCRDQTLWLYNLTRSRAEVSWQLISEDFASEELQVWQIPEPWCTLTMDPKI